MDRLNDHKNRAHAKCSASSADRWLHCPATVKLSEQYPPQDTAYTREGTLAHEVAELMASGGDAPEVIDGSGITPEMIRHAEAYRDYIAELSEEHTTKLLEVRVDFSAWVPEGFGTADCILLTDDRMDVIDFKYGQGVAVDSYNNPQMMLYGLGALNDYGFIYEVQKIRLHIFQPRKDNISTYETTPEALLKFGEYARQRAEDALGSTPSSCSGAWCKFCPHAGRCSRLAFDGLSCVSNQLTICPDVDTLSAEDLARVLKYAPMISDWLKAVNAAALSDLMNGDEVPGYKVVEGKLGNRKWADELQAMQALEAAGIPKEDYTTVSLLSPSALEKVLGKKKAAELIAPLVSRSPGAPTIVPETDKRPKLDRLAQAKEDFN